MSDPRKAIVERGYDALGQTYLSWASRITSDPRTRMLAAFSARLAGDARILDLGCGAGLPSTITLAERFDVTGVDISQGQIDSARRNVPTATFIKGDIAEVEFAPASFDGVTAFYAVSHLPRAEHERLFKRVADWLVPGGLFLATLGAHDSPDWVGPWLGRPMFFSSWDAAVNRGLVEGAGFQVLIDDVIDTLEPDGPVPFLWVLASRR